MMEGRNWYWVVGQDSVQPPDSIGGTTVPQIILSGIKFRAEALRAPVANEIAGGLHPVAQIWHYGYVTRGRCFVSNGMRLVLPSIGNYSSGTNVLSPDFDPFLGQGELLVWFISGACHPVGAPQLIEAAPRFRCPLLGLIFRPSVASRRMGAGSGDRYE